MFAHLTHIRVRYAETDQMAYVYYGNYATYYEVARVEAFRALGYPYKSLEQELGVMMPVLELHTRYIQPAKYDDLLSVRVEIPELPTAKIVFRYEIRNEQDILLNTGETTLVFVNTHTNRPCRCPQPLRDLLLPFFGQCI